MCFCVRQRACIIYMPNVGYSCGIQLGVPCEHAWCTRQPMLTACTRVSNADAMQLGSQPSCSYFLSCCTHFWPQLWPGTHTPGDAHLPFGWSTGGGGGVICLGAFAEAHVPCSSPAQQGLPSAQKATGCTQSAALKREEAGVKFPLIAAVVPAPNNLLGLPNVWCNTAVSNSAGSCAKHGAASHRSSVEA